MPGRRGSGNGPAKAGHYVTRPLSNCSVRLPGPSCYVRLSPDLDQNVSEPLNCTIRPSWSSDGCNHNGP